MSVSHKHRAAVFRLALACRGGCRLHRHFARTRWPIQCVVKLGSWLALSLGAAATAGAMPGDGLTCRVPQEAPPCAAGHDIGPLSEPHPDTGTSNPIHRSTGEKFLREIDLPEPLQGGHPGFTRFYRSSQTQPGILGPGWASGYALRLQRHAGGWRMHLPNGRHVDYDAHGQGEHAGTGRIDPLPEPPPTRHAEHFPSATLPLRTPIAAHRWHDAYGQQLDFDQAGRLLAIRFPGRAETRIDYHPSGPLKGHIHRVTTQDPTTAAGLRRSTDGLSFHYDAEATGAPRLQRLETPLGTFHYGYDHEGRLQTVRRPDAMQRHYHHEAERQAGGQATLITGLTLAAPTGETWRARTWSYDRQGRVITAIPGPPAPDGSGQGRLDLQYSAAATEKRPDAARPHWDRQGRLTALAGLRLVRGPSGRIHQLQQEDGGWPGLRIQYDDQGRRSAWSSTLTGTTRLHYDAPGRLTGIQAANGRWLDIRSDPAGRPVNLTHRAPGQASVAVTIRWHGRRPVRLHHPSETEYLAYTHDGRLHTRTVHRPHPAGAVQYQERLEWTAAGRLRRHHLPEGGLLEYEWAGGTRLTAITWQDAHGVRHPVIHTVPGLAGYRSGNGLHHQTAADHRGRAHALLLTAGTDVLWGEWRQAGEQNLTARQFIESPPLRLRSATTLNHDDRRRLIRVAEHRVAASSSESVHPAWPGQTAPQRPTAQVQPAETQQIRWLGWQADGSLLIDQTNLDTPLSPPAHRRVAPLPEGLDRLLPQKRAAPARGQTFVRDAGGLPVSDPEGLRLTYGAQGRLTQVEQRGKVIAQYIHNARGQQIRQQYDGEETERYYVDNRLVALWHRPFAPPQAAEGDAATAPARSARAQAASPRFGVSQRYLYAHEVPVGLLQTHPNGQTELFYIHADLLGAPVLVTDQQQRIRWAAHYDALGSATRIAGDLTIPLRRPGQDEDPATGWHDNVFRTYLPARGHYLEPDPLGPLPAQQALGYAAQRPLHFIDPLGLILLAFDGSRLNASNQSNVWKLGQAYADGPVLYRPGPGNNRQLDWDAITAASSHQIQRGQWQALLGVLADAQGQRAPVPVDILGYSRGAALARDFANRIAANTRDGWFSYDDPVRGNIGLCIDMRFLGLFETVAQFGLLGAANAGFDLSIHDAWSWVAHAVALHERRSLFPLVSATDGDAHNTIEAPFIGAHADIGGGLLLDAQGKPIPNGDLSDVALNWMHWQAMAALVPMASLSAAERTVTQPLLHDERLPAQRLNAAGDRPLQNSRTQAIGQQGDDARLGAAQRQQFDLFIQRISGWQINAGKVVGTVDMAAYNAWLQDTLGVRLDP